MVDTPAFMLWGHIRFAGYTIGVVASMPGADDLKKFVHSISATWDCGVRVVQGGFEILTSQHRASNCKAISFVHINIFGVIGSLRSVSRQQSMKKWKYCLDNRF